MMMEDFLSDNPDWSTRTRDWYKHRLTHFEQFLGQHQTDLQNVTPRTINIYLGQLKQAGLSWSTRNGAYTILSNWFSWLRANKVIDHNPFADLDLRPKRPKKRRRVTKTLPIEYMQAMILAAKRSNSIYSCRDVAIMYLLATTGMRRAEITNLQLSHISNQTIFIRGKNEDERLAYLRDDSLIALMGWLATRPKTNAKTVFVSLHHNKKGLYQPLEPDAINALLIKWRNEAKLPPISVSPHKWRHTFATHLARAGNPFALQMLLGHADISTTKMYVHPGDDELRQMVRNFAPKI